MSTTVTYNGQSFTVPAVGDASWGTNVSNYLIALATGSLTKAGGAFTLTGEVDFGGTYGLKSLYFKTKTVTPSLTGVVRLANGDAVGWRNVANNADLLLGVNGSNQLTFGGVAIPTVALGGANQLLGMNAAGTANEYKTLGVGAFSSLTIVQGVGTVTFDAIQDIRTSASPTFAGATLTGFNGVLKASAGSLSASPLVNADVSATAAIAYSKLNLASAILNSDISASAAIAYSKLNLAASIATSDLASGLLVPVTKGGTGVTTSTGTGSTVLSTSPTLTTPIQASYEDFTEISTPANPSSGKLRIYPKSDDRLYTLNSAGVESAVGASGTGELDLVGSPSTATGWTKTGTTGAGANAPVTTSSAGDLPLGGIVSTAIQFVSGTSAGAEASNYSSYPFTTPAAYAVKTKVEFWMRPGTNFIANEWTVSVYAGSTRQALTTDASGVTYLPNGLGKFTAYFDAVASTAYTLRFARVTNAGANAGVLNVANVIVGPGIQPQGAVASAPVTYVPASAGFGTISSVNFTWEQVASRCRVVGEFVAGTPTATAASLTLPNSWTAATPGNTTIIIGKWERYSATGSQVKTGTIIANAGSNTVNFSADDTGTSLNPFVSQNGSALFFASDIISVDFSVQINQLAGSGTVNLAQNDAQYQYSTDGATTAGAVGSAANTAYGPNGTLINSIASTTTTSNSTTDFPITMQPALQAGETTQVEINQGFGWVPANFLVPYIDQGTARYGIRLEVNSATQVTVRFGNAGSIPSSGTYGAAGSAWSTLNGAGWKWRIKRVVGGQAIGFSAYQPPSSSIPAGISGLVPALGLPGRTDGNAVAAGYVGERLTSAPSGNISPGSTGSYVNLASVPLTPGVWEVSGTVDWISGSMAGFQAMIAGISLTSAALDVVQANNIASIGYQPINSATSVNVPVGSRYLNVSANTNVYLVGRCNYTGALGTSLFNTSNATFLQAVRRG